MKSEHLKLKFRYYDKIDILTVRQPEYCLGYNWFGQVDVKEFAEAIFDSLGQDKVCYGTTKLDINEHLINKTFRTIKSYFI